MSAFKSRRFVIDDSSSESGASVASAVDLVNTSSDDDAVGTNLRTPQKATDLDTLMKGVDKVTITDKGRGRASLASKYGPSVWDASDSDSDDSLFQSYTPAFPRKAPPIRASTIDFSSDDESEVSIVNTAVESSMDKNQSDRFSWQLDETRREYSLSSKAGTRMPTFKIPQSLFDSLYPHQKEGVAWMVGLHHGGLGGLLGDDMGMGKTYQTLTLLGGLMRSKTIKNALVVAPLSLLRSWEKEAYKVMRQCVPHVHIQVVSSDTTRRTRQRRIDEALECYAGSPHFVITTYGLIQSSHMDFVDEDFGFDYVILDEAQKIKNHIANVSKNIRRVSKNEDTRRLILTGTPIMNNLRELWALFDFVTAGRLLGPVQRFNNRFQRPIEDSRNKNATQLQIDLGDKANNELQELLQPFLLQRLKADYLADQLPTKSDMIIWTHISDEQRRRYSEYVESKESAVACVLSGMVSSPLVAISWLKKLCGHPILVDDADEVDDLSTYEPRELKERSSKLKVLDALVETLRRKGHRTLIFSQSTKMLDIIQRVLRRIKGLGRIDGTTKEKDRQRFVDEFNDENGSIEVMLLSTKAAGIGLTLTGADRAIIYDPSWNPAEDSQAVDRCYRIGQKKEVSVFRLIAAGTVEEKIYEKQVHKDGIRRAVVTSAGTSITRYFDTNDLSKLFTLNPSGQCDFLEKLREKGLLKGNHGISSAHEGIVGVSSHDVVYSEDAIDLLTGAPKPAGRASMPKDNPFASPTKFTKPAMLFEGSEAQEPKSNTFLGRSQRAMNNINKTTNDVTPPKKSNHVDLTTERQFQNEDAKTIPQNVGFVLQKALAKADGFVAMGQRELAVDILMDTMESSYENLNKAQKLQLHSRMSTIAYGLQWL